MTSPSLKSTMGWKAEVTPGSEPFHNQRGIGPGCRTRGWVMTGEMLPDGTHVYSSCLRTTAATPTWRASGQSLHGLVAPDIRGIPLMGREFEKFRPAGRAPPQRVGWGREARRGQARGPGPGSPGWPPRPGSDLLPTARRTARGNDARATPTPRP